jgi:hypothetical protein
MDGVLDRELRRSRRFGRPMSVVRLPTRAVAEAARLCEVVDASTREVDTVWIDEKAVIALLPETGPNGAAALLDRLRKVVAGEVLAAARAVTFPTNGYTRGALLAALREGTPQPGAPLDATAAPTMTLVPAGELAVPEEQAG